MKIFFFVLLFAAAATKEDVYLPFLPLAPHPALYPNRDVHVSRRPSHRGDLRRRRLLIASSVHRFIGSSVHRFKKLCASTSGMTESIFFCSFLVFFSALATTGRKSCTLLQRTPACRSSSDSSSPTSGISRGSWTLSLSRSQKWRSRSSGGCPTSACAEATNARQRQRHRRVTARCKVASEDKNNDKNANTNNDKYERIRDNAVHSKSDAYCQETNTAERRRKYNYE